MPRENFSLKMDGEIKKRLYEAAKKENRTSSNLTESIVLKWLDEYYPNRSPLCTEVKSDEK